MILLGLAGKAQSGKDTVALHLQKRYGFIRFEFAATLEETAERLDKLRRMMLYPEQQPQYFVNPTCRFPNEQEWIHAQGGNVWHIHRDGVDSVAEHVSETPLPVLDGEREIWNNGTIARLCDGIDTLLRSNMRFIRIEQMLPSIEP